MPVHGVSLCVSYAMTVIIMRMWLDSNSCLQPSCSLSVNRLLRSKAQVHLSAPLHFFSESIGSAAVLYIITSLAAFLHYVSSAAFVSSAAVVYCVMSHRPAARHLLSWKVPSVWQVAKLSSQLQSVCSVIMCHLGSSLSAQSVISVTIRQLSCEGSGQLSSHPQPQL